MSSTAQPTGLTGTVDQQRKFDNSQATGPGLPQQGKFENKEFGPTARTTQQSQQQPGYLQQAYEGVTNLVSGVASAIPGTTGVSTTGTGTGIAAPQPLHPAAQRLKQQHGPTGGVGSLPGTPNEEDVVRLPEERQHPDPLAEERERKAQIGGRLDPTSTTNAFASGAPAGSGTLPSALGSNIDQPAGTHPHTTGGSALGSNFDHHHGLGQEHQKQSGIEGARIRADPTQPGFGASTTTHSTSTTHPTGDPRGVTTTGVRPHHDTEGVGASRPVEAAKETVHKATGEREYENPEDPNHKPTMMEKMKGQAKIISGKMTKDTEKVEEGRALKSAH